LPSLRPTDVMPNVKPTLCYLESKQPGLRAACLETRLTERPCWPLLLYSLSVRKFMWKQGVKLRVNRFFLCTSPVSYSINIFQFDIVNYNELNPSLKDGTQVKSWICVIPQHTTICVTPQHTIICVNPQHTTICVNSQHTTIYVSPQHTTVCVGPQHTTICVSPHSTPQYVSAHSTPQSSMSIKQHASKCLLSLHRLPQIARN